MKVFSESDHQICRDAFRDYFGLSLPDYSTEAEGIFGSSNNYYFFVAKILYFKKSVIEPLIGYGMQTNDRIVDIAAGDGQMSVALYLMGYKNLILFDLDPERLSLASRSISFFSGEETNVKSINDSATNFSEPVDVLISYQTIEHLSDKGNYSVASRKCQREFLKRVNDNVSKLVYINAPNLLFPVDGHDTGLWFFHYLPSDVRSKMIEKKWVTCSWAGVSQPVSVPFLSRYLKNFKLASTYYSFSSAEEYMQNYAPFDYVGNPYPLYGVKELPAKKKLIVRLSKMLGKAPQYFLPVLSVVMAKNGAVK